MFDCVNYKLTRINPLKNQVLVEVIQHTQSGPIHLPDDVITGAFGMVARGHGQEAKPAQEGIVRRIGSLDGPPELVEGDRVIIKAYSGKQINEPPREFRMVNYGDVVAKFV